MKKEKMVDRNVYKSQLNIMLRKPGVPPFRIFKICKIRALLQ